MNKFVITEGLLESYKQKRIIETIKYEYGSGSLKLNGVKLANFSEVKLYVIPNIRSMIDMRGREFTRASSYKIEVEMNIVKKYSRYDKVNKFDDITIDIDNQLIIKGCNIDKHTKKIYNVRLENIEWHDDKNDEWWK